MSTSSYVSFIISVPIHLLLSTFPFSKTEKNGWVEYHQTRFESSRTTRVGHVDDDGRKTIDLRTRLGVIDALIYFKSTVTIAQGEATLLSKSVRECSRMIAQLLNNPLHTSASSPQKIRKTVQYARYSLRNDFSSFCHIIDGYMLSSAGQNQGLILCNPVMLSITCYR